MTNGWSNYELNKWSVRLAADDWAWVTWKAVIFDIGAVILWLAFFYLLISNIAKTLKHHSNGKGILAAFVLTWTSAMFAWGAMFSEGPLGYFLYTSLDSGTYSSVKLVGYQYFTLLGLVFNDF